MATWVFCLQLMAFFFFFWETYHNMNSKEFRDTSKLVDKLVNVFFFFLQIVWSTDDGKGIILLLYSKVYLP